MDEIKSKTQKKQEAHALQKIGVKLITLSEERLNTLPLTESLKHAIMTAKALRSHGAIRRQAQLIGKLMRAADGDNIKTALDNLMAEDEAQSASFHTIEHWRQRLLQEGNPALTEFIESYQPDEVQKLRQLIKKAQAEQASGHNLGAYKALFRFLRACIE